MDGLPFEIKASSGDIVFADTPERALFAGYQLQIDHRTRGYAWPTITIFFEGQPVLMTERIRPSDVHRRPVAA